MLELKYGILSNDIFSAISFNRTMLELKLAKAFCF